MILDLSLEETLAVCISDAKSDPIASHLLCAIPENETWAVVNLRNPVSIAFAIGRTNITPVAFIGEIERTTWLDQVDSPGLDSVLLDMLSKRARGGLTVNLLEALNILSEKEPETPESDGV